MKNILLVLLTSFFLLGTVYAQNDLAQKSQNPVSDLISLPFQNNTLFGIGPDDDTANVLNIQPVIPIRISQEWNLITRTIIPLIYLPDLTNGLPELPQGLPGDSTFGLGDINFTGFLSPANPGKLIWGIGPSISIPTATDDILGTEKWSAGPSVVLLSTPSPWVYGVLVRQLWSFAGEEERSDVSQMLIQPFLNYNLPESWYLVSAPVITANWEADSDNTWTVPLGGGVGKIFRIGKLPVNAQSQVFYNVEHPDFGPDWSLRIQLQLLFPK